MSIFILVRLSKLAKTEMSLDWCDSIERFWRLIKSSKTEVLLIELPL